MFGRAPKKSDNSRYYEILGVSKDASTDELKKAYKKAAIKNHPDKGGDPEKFKELAQAYEVLNDPEKKELYDEYGEDALKEGMGGPGSSHNPFEIFESFFGGSPFGGVSRNRHRQRRGEDVIHRLKVSLEELYNGTLKKISLSRNVICLGCNGKGSKSGVTCRCSGCQGSGMKVTIRQLGPGMMQQMQQVCADCQGSGESVNEKDRCPQCEGRKVVEDKKVLDVHVEKGMQHGQKLTFQGKADEAPETITGDIIVVLQLKDHPKFTRKDEDLFLDHSLSLVEALCGFKFIVTHLDGRQLLVKCTPGEIIKPGQYKLIMEEGMPHHGRPFMKGSLYIHFTINFPDSGSLSPEQRKALEAALPPRPTLQLTDVELEECEEVTLHDVKYKEHIQSEACQEDEEGSEPRVQCAQQ